MVKFRLHDMQIWLLWLSSLCRCNPTKIEPAIFKRTLKTKEKYVIHITQYVSNKKNHNNGMQKIFYRLNIQSRSKSRWISVFIMKWKKKTLLWENGHPEWNVKKWTRFGFQKTFILRIWTQALINGIMKNFKERLSGCPTIYSHK